MNKKMLVFDMDGTIADLYNVTGWLDDLRAFNPRPYKEASPLYDMIELNKVLNAFKAKGWQIAITSWLSKESTKEYDKKVREAKKEWLKKHNFPYDEVHLVKYGTTKAECTRRKADFQILIDDNAEVRKGWTLGATIDANKDIIKELLKVL